jgi:hypothetical protein
MLNEHQKEVRKNFTIGSFTQQRIDRLMGKGCYITEAELLRACIKAGLNVIEGKWNK